MLKLLKIIWRSKENLLFPHEKFIPWYSFAQDSSSDFLLLRPTTTFYCILLAQSQTYPLFFPKKALGNDPFPCQPMVFVGSLVFLLPLTVSVACDTFYFLITNSAKIQEILFLRIFVEFGATDDACDYLLKGSRV